MPANRPSLLRATAPWFAGALLGSLFFLVAGWGGNPLGHAIVTLAPWLFWLGPAYGTRKGLQALDRFAREVPEAAEASSPLLGYPTLRWPERGLAVEARTYGPSLVGLVLTVEGEGTARVSADRAREAARAALEGRIEHPTDPDGAPL